MSETKRIDDMLDSNCICSGEAHEFDCPWLLFQGFKKQLAAAQEEIKKLNEDCSAIESCRAALQARNQKLVEALEECQAKQPQAIKILRKHNFVFDDKGGKWEKLAFTFYTDLCEVSETAKLALEGE